ncbi:MAG: hypothetical protein MI923_06620 [Phycisphaerales bacterium]|nr:hypothetical protein [Phycisphaerales bacterium]
MHYYPSKIYILRHAEKPEGASERLSTKGYERAAALAYYLPSIESEIHSIFAAGIGTHSPSHRPKETVKPLARRLCKCIDDSFLKDRSSELVAHILKEKKYEGRALVICWEHTFIDKIAKDFNACGIPSEKWPASRFDLVWKLTYMDQDPPYKLEQIPQCLMYNDSDTCIGG